MSSDFALALHTVTSNLEIAIADLGTAGLGFDGAIDHGGTLQVHSQSWLLGREMSLKLHICLQEFMAERRWQDCRWLAVAQGIGSYAGTRMGVVVARTLAQQLEIPLYGFDCDEISTYAQANGFVNQAAALLLLAQRRYAVNFRNDHASEPTPQTSQALKSHWSSVLPLYAESV